MRATVSLAVIAAAVVAISCLVVGVETPPVCSASSSICEASLFRAVDDAVGALATLGLGVGAAFALSILWQARRHWRLTKLLDDGAEPAFVAEHSVLLVPGLATPFVAGLVRPQIYWPADLSERLTAAELRAVVLHERHHQVTRAPLRLLTLAALGPVIRHVAVGRRWSEQRRAAIEIAADEHALRIGAHRPELARALLKLGPVALDPGLPSYASASELRLRYLLDGTNSTPRGLDALVSVLVILGSVLVCTTRG